MPSTEPARPVRRAAGRLRPVPGAVLRRPGLRGVGATSPSTSPPGSRAGTCGTMRAAGSTTQLRPRGFPGCVAYDCFGAGQHVVQVTVRRSRARGRPCSGVLPVVRALHELLWYVADVRARTAAGSRPRCGPGGLRARRRRLADGDVGRAARGGRRRRARRASIPLLRQASALVRAPLPEPAPRAGRVPTRRRARPAGSRAEPICGRPPVRGGSPGRAADRGRSARRGPAGGRPDRRRPACGGPAGGRPHRRAVPDPRAGAVGRGRRGHADPGTGSRRAGRTGSSMEAGSRAAVRSSRPGARRAGSAPSPASTSRRRCGPPQRRDASAVLASRYGSSAPCTCSTGTVGRRATAAANRRPSARTCERTAHR